MWAFKSADMTYKERDKDKATRKRAAKIIAEEEKMVANNYAIAAKH